MPIVGMYETLDLFKFWRQALRFNYLGNMKVIFVFKVGQRRSLKCKNVERITAD